MAERALFGLQNASLYPHACRAEQASSWLGEVPPSKPGLIVIISQRPHLLIPSHWGIGFNIAFLWEQANSAHDSNKQVNITHKVYFALCFWSTCSPCKCLLQHSLWCGCLSFFLTLRFERTSLFLCILEHLWCCSEKSLIY